MEKGYYKPELEEFCVGLELLLQNIENAQWGKYIFKESDSVLDFITGGCLEDDRVMVKLLDQEDIEAEGFDHDQTTKDGAQFYKGHLMSPKQISLCCPNARKEDYTKIQISDITDLRNIDDLFSGTIRNRTEFRKLLNQLEV